MYAAVQENINRVLVRITSLSNDPRQYSLLSWAGWRFVLFRFLVSKVPNRHLRLRFLLDGAFAPTSDQHGGMKPSLSRRVADA